MNLQNFEQQINQTILDRGYGYYLDDLVELASFQEGTYHFQVAGSNDYEVVITLDENGTIISSYCDCPYTYGLVCKHEVAVYFELDELLSGGEAVMIETKREVLTDVLSDLSKDELIAIIDELARQDDIVNNRLLIKYSKQDAGQEVVRFKKWIRSIVDANKGRRGFIHYGETNRFVSELGECLVQIEDCTDPVLALDLAFLVLEEAIEAFQYADDSDGDIGSLADDTIEAIERTILDAMNSEFGQQKLFEKLLLIVEHPMFDGWEEYQTDVLGICIHFTDRQECRVALIEKIESMVDVKTSNHYRQYYNESLNRLLFAILERNGTAEEVTRFLEEHIQYSSFREQLIRRYLKEKEYHQVIQLAMAGERADKELKGLLVKWKGFRYAAYKALDLQEEQRTLAEELFMDGDFDYYQEMKVLAAEPRQFYEQLKQELRVGRDWKTANLFRRLIEEENDTAELMEFVRQNPATIETYASGLMEVYKEEVLEVYKEYILQMAARSSNRKGYQHVCGIIRRYEKLAGKQLQHAVVAELRESYVRKPAFMDELGKFSV